MPPRCFWGEIWIELAGVHDVDLDTPSRVSFLVSFVPISGLHGMS